MMASGKSLPFRKHLSHNKTLELNPALNNNLDMVKAFVMYNCQARNMERLCLEDVLSTAEKGAFILNHVEVTSLISNQYKDILKQRNALSLQTIKG
jgi:glycerol-3-phosphate dehydrogenase